MTLSGSALDARIPWVTERQLGYWVEQGWVRPVNPGTRSRGPGNGRVFSDEEGRVLVAMARLVRAGFRPSFAAKIARRAAAQGSGTVSVDFGDGIKLFIGGL